ncbi:MAG: hypothetical protein J5662_00090, partial [Clostridia bacterium]|nr:hypothetical protein [Clostridia bacterium]
MKKSLAWVVSLAIVLSIFVFPASFFVSATEHVYYVSSSGSDSNAGTEAAPFATIAKAQTELAALEDSVTAVDGTIYVSGTVDFEGGVSHKGVHTFIGKSGTSPNARLVGSNSINSSFGYVVVIKGPTIFDSIGIPKNGNTSRLLTNGYPVELINCNIGSDPSQVFLIANYDNAECGKVVVKDWVYGNNYAYYLDNYITAFGSSTSNTSPGCNVVFEGNTRYVNLGKNNMTSTFNGDVNITFNGGTLAVKTYVEGTNTLNGALQMIFNDGATVNTSTDAMANVSAADGVWRLFGSSGSFVETTALAGTFKVPDGYVATATTRSGGAQIDSVGGYLTLPAGIYDFECEVDSGSVTPTTVFYVSSSGNDSNTGITALDPFATIAKAQAALAAQETAETAVDGTIYVSGTVDFVGGVSHKGVHTIEGLNDTPTVRSNGAYANATISNVSILGGPMIFDSVRFAWNNSAQILTNGYPVEINNCSAASSIQMFFGNYNNANAVRENVVVNNWTTESKYLDPYIAAFGPTASANTSPGCDIVFNGGIKFVNLGKTGITSTFSGDVNVTFNSGTTAVNTYTEGTNTLNGALQMVFNNGVTVNSSKDAMANVSAAGGVWRLFGSAGSFVETTATAGTFKVPDGYIATATNRSGGAQTNSVGGYLTLPAGIYDFECEINYQTIEESVYVSSSGDDNNAGTELAPFATIDKAQEVLAAMETEAITVDGTIFVSGTVNFATSPAHKGVHTIKGNGNTPTVYPNPAYLNATISNALVLHGPTVFDSVAISPGASSSRRIVTNGYPVEFNNCSSPSTSSYTQLYIGNYDNTVRENVVVNNWTTESKYLDPYIAAFGPGASNTSAGCDVVFDGGVKYVNLGKSGFTSTFNGDVNVTFNSGTTAVNTYTEGTNTLNGALQMVFNNGVTVNSSKDAMANVPATGGVWRLFGGVGSFVEITATAGTFKIPSGYTAIATNRSSGAQIESVGNYLTLPAGTYDFVCGTSVDTVYVSESGDDSNDGLTPETPFATINKAQQLLIASVAESKPIMVTGTVNFDGGLAHTDMIEIVGQ